MIKVGQNIVTLENRHANYSRRDSLLQTHYSMPIKTLWTGKYHVHVHLYGKKNHGYPLKIKLFTTSPNVKAGVMKWTRVQSSSLSLDTNITDLGLVVMSLKN